MLRLVGMIFLSMRFLNTTTKGPYAKRNVERFTEVVLATCFLIIDLTALVAKIYTCLLCRPALH